MGPVVSPRREFQRQYANVAREQQAAWIVNDYERAVASEPDMSLGDRAEWLSRLGEAEVLLDPVLYAKDRRLRYNHGITLTEYVSVLDRQGGRCPGCGVKDSGFNLVVDHDHETKVVRGLLCRDCNVALGILKDDARRLLRLAGYVVREQSEDDLRVRRWRYSSTQWSAPKAEDVA